MDSLPLCCVQFYQVCDAFPCVPDERAVYALWAFSARVVGSAPRRSRATSALRMNVYHTLQPRMTAMDERRPPVVGSPKTATPRPVWMTPRQALRKTIRMSCVDGRRAHLEIMCVTGLVTLMLM
jgi:hypothetical protein